MGRNQKIVATCMWAVLVVAMTAMVASGVWLHAQRSEVAGQRSQQSSEQSSGALPVLFAAPSFQLQDQDGAMFGDRDLRGTPYVAAFIYTNCTSICPMMSGKMAKLQQTIPDARVKLVSFTVDPKRDTPAVLKKYAQRLGATDGRWYFLTGTEQQMKDVVTGMKVGSADTPLNHSERFVLVDGQGQVRGTYLSLDDDSMTKLKADIESLLGAGK